MNFIAAPIDAWPVAYRPLAGRTRSKRVSLHTENLHA